MSICHIHGQVSLPAIDVVQNAYGDLGLSQTVGLSGSEWTRSVNQSLGITQSFSDFYGETVVSNMALASAFDGDRLLLLSVTSAIVFSQVSSVAGGRIGGGAASSFSIIYDSVGPAALEGNVVYVDAADSEAKLATNAGTEPQGEVAGVLLQGVSAGGNAIVATEGEVDIPNWTSIIGTATLIPGATYYLGTAGAMSSTPPVTGSIVIIGRAMTATKFDIEINLPWVV